MKKLLIHGLIYGLCGGLLIALLKLIEYRFIVLEHSIEIYGGLIALLFAGVGIWLGLKVRRLSYNKCETDFSLSSAERQAKACRTQLRRKSWNWEIFPSAWR